MVTVPNISAQLSAAALKHRWSREEIRDVSDLLLLTMEHCKAVVASLRDPMEQSWKR